jgi:tetratricopeptide (TPR) repeat protein
MGYGMRLLSHTGIFVLLMVVGCARPIRELPPYYHYSKGLMLEEEGRWQEAAEAYRAAALRDSASAEPWLALADLSRRRALWSEACASYGRAAELSSLDKDTLAAWLRCCGWAQDLDGVRSAYHASLEQHPGNARAVLEALRLEIELGGNPDGVVSDYGYALADPEHASEAAKLLIEEGLPSIAEELLRPFAEDLRLAVWLGISLEAQQRTSEAAELYEHLADAHPDEQVPLVRLFNLLRGGGQTEEAVDAGKRLAARETDGAVYAKTVGLYALQEGAIAAAKQVLRAALPRASDDSGVHYLLASTYSREDSLEQALSEALEAARLDTTSPEPLLLAGWTFVRADRGPEAAVLLKKHLESTGRDPRVLFLLGSLLVQTDAYTEALPLLKEAAGADSTEPRVFYELGVAYEQSDSVDAAASAFRECLRLDPENASAYNYLGYMLADRGLELEEALRLINTALGLEPENGYFVDSLGWVLYRLGRLEEAKRELERAALLVEDAVVREHLGLVYLDLGMREEAHEQLRKAVDLGSTSDEVLRTLKTLSEEER